MRLRTSLFLLALLAAPAVAAEEAEPAAAASKCKLLVSDMHCSGCVAGVKRAARTVDGVTDVQVELEKREVLVTYDAAKTKPEAVRDAIGKVYQAELVETEDADAPAPGDPSSDP